LDHREHNIISLDNGLQKKKSEIESKMQKVRANVPSLRNEKESLEKRRTRVNKSIEKATEELHRTAEHNIQLIRQHEASVTERLIKQKLTFHAAFLNTMTSLDKKLVEIKSSLDFGNEILQRNNLPEILNVEEVLEQRFQELMEPFAFDLKVDYSTVKYVSNDLSSLKDSPGKLLTTNTEPSLTVVDGMGLTEGVKGEDCTFTVITNDSQENKTYSEIDGVDVYIQSLQTRKSVKVTIADCQDGCYRVSYKPKATGEFKVVITVAGEAIKGSPFQLNVEERKGRQKPRWDCEESKVSETLLKMQTIHPTSEPKCSMCMNLNKDPVYQTGNCGHWFCKSCKKRFLEKAMRCPVCKKENLFRGNQPVGYIAWRTESNNQLPGYEKYGTIVITYNFKQGIQGSDHPNPGEPYSDLFCTSYLPNNPAGQDLCKLLRSAFLARLIFTIGKCPATGEENKIVSNGIELKWNRSGGPANCGYPDPSYLDRIESQLAERGITQFSEYE